MGSSDRFGDPFRKPFDQDALYPLPLTLPLPCQQGLLQGLQSDGFDPGLEAVVFVPAVDDKGLVRGDVLRG